METPGVGERGKNWATKHDFEVLLEQVRATTRAMEAIRNELSGQLWVAQERWKFKAELYRTLIENLSEVGVAWNAAYDVLKANDFTVVSVEAFGRAIDEAEARHAAIIRRAAAVARVFLSPRTLEALDAFNDAMGGHERTSAPADLDRTSAAIAAARDALVENAREDLTLDLTRP